MDKNKDKSAKLTSIVGVLLNIVLFVLKFMVGTLFNSVSILADAMNNFSDLLSSTIALVGFKLGEKPADQEHPFGHERFEYISGFLMSIMMLYIGVDLFRTSISSVFTQEEAVLDKYMLLVMLISILIKGFLYFYYKHNFEKTKSDVILAAQYDSRNDVLISVVIIAGFFINQLFKVNVDGILGCLISVFIMISSVQLLKEFIDELVGYRPSQKLIDSVIESVMEQKDVFSYHDLMIHEYGDHTYYGTIHIEIDQRLSLIVAHEIAHRIENDVLDTTGVILVVHLDPIDVVSDEIKHLHMTVKTTLKHLDSRFKFHDLRIIENNVEVDVVLFEENKLSESEIEAALRNVIDTKYDLKITFDRIQLH